MNLSYSAVVYGRTLGDIQTQAEDLAKQFFGTTPHTITEIEIQPNIFANLKHRRRHDPPDLPYRASVWATADNDGAA